MVSLKNVVSIFLPGWWVFRKKGLIIYPSRKDRGGRKKRHYLPADFLLVVFFHRKFLIGGISLVYSVYSCNNVSVVCRYIIIVEGTCIWGGGSYCRRCSKVAQPTAVVCPLAARKRSADDFGAKFMVSSLESARGLSCNFI